MIFIFSSLPLVAQVEKELIEHKVEVVLVEISLFVVDKKGNPVTDLKKEELALYEDGKKQNISHFVLIRNDSPEIQSLARIYPSASRQIMLLFDFAFSNPIKVARARSASLDFIKEKVLPTDLIAVAIYSGTGGINILSHFTSDREQLLDVLGTLGLDAPDSEASGPVKVSFPDFTPVRGGGKDSTGGAEREESGRSIGDEEMAELMGRLGSEARKANSAHVLNFIDEMKELSAALNTIQGRKHIIYFSEGFDGSVVTGDAIMREELFAMLRNITNADCSIHTVNIGGIPAYTGGDQNLQPLLGGKDGLSIFSKETGGQAYKNMNVLDKPLEDILRITNSHYIIGYYPEDKREKGDFRRIKVTTVRKRIRISYRKGYFEPKPFYKYSKLEKELHLLELITKDILRDDIEFDIYTTVFPGKNNINRVPVFFKFPGKQILGRKGEIVLEIYGYAVTDEGVFRDFFHQTVTLDLKDNREKLLQTGLKYFDLNLLPPGRYKLKMIARNARTGAVGVKIKMIDVPDFSDGKLALSGPAFFSAGADWVAIKGYDPRNPSGRKKGLNIRIDYPFVLKSKDFVPGIVPDLERTKPAHFYLWVHNLELDPVTKHPRTRMTVEAVDQTGYPVMLKKLVLLEKPFEIEPGTFGFYIEVDPGELSLGSYEMRVTFDDLGGRQSAVAKAQFRLVDYKKD